MNRKAIACFLFVLLSSAIVTSWPCHAAPPTVPPGGEAAKIKELRAKRIELLKQAQKVATAQYRVGTIDCSSVCAIERESLEAAIDAAEIGSQRIAAFEESQRSADELVKIANARFAAAHTSELDVDLAKSLALDTRINVSRGRHAAAAEINQLQQKRIVLLSKAREMATAQLRVGTIDFLGAKNIERDWLEARLDVAETPSKRIAVLEESLKSAEDLVKVIDIIMVGRSNEPDLGLAKAYAVEIKIRLIRERQAAGAGKK